MVREGFGCGGRDFNFDGVGGLVGWRDRAGVGKGAR